MTSYGFRTNFNKNEIKDIRKVIRSLENKGIPLKGSTKTAINKKIVFLSNVFGPLIRVGLPLIKKCT